jgi:signal transduction histidine kinase
MLGNIGGYVAVSLGSGQGAIERIQATLFVDVLRQSADRDEARFWRGTATVADLYNLVTRFVGRSQADRAFAAYGRRRDINLKRLKEADADLVNFAERLLAGAIGAASARVMVSSVTKGEIVSIDEVMEILDEASHVIEHSHQLEQKSRQLQAASAQLRAANERLKELDRLKDDFIATVSHELRTPLTSVRSFGEILYDNPDLDPDERRNYLHIIINESERLTRLIAEVLDLAKMEAGRMEWHVDDIDPRAVIEEAAAIARGLSKEHPFVLDLRLPEAMRPVHVDRDRLIQVIVNLLSNAVKFCDGPDARIVVAAEELPAELRISVTDNGIGIARETQEMIFEKFQQVGDDLGDKPSGTGLGLPICRQIVQHFGGRIWVESTPGEGLHPHRAGPYGAATAAGGARHALRRGCSPHRRGRGVERGGCRRRGPARRHRDRARYHPSPRFPGRRRHRDRRGNEHASPHDPRQRLSVPCHRRDAPPWAPPYAGCRRWRADRRHPSPPCRPFDRRQPDGRRDRSARP